MVGTAVFRMVVSSDSMKNATATSQGSSRLRESIGESGAGAGIGRSTLTFMKKIEADGPAEPRAVQVPCALCNDRAPLDERSAEASGLN
jgi:hypothetical protein